MSFMTPGKYIVKADTSILWKDRNGTDGNNDLIKAPPKIFSSTTYILTSASNLSKVMKSLFAYRQLLLRQHKYSLFDKKFMSL